MKSLPQILELVNYLRVGKLPEEVYDWMRPESNENKDKVPNPNN